MPDSRDKPITIPFSGKLMTADPSVIGQNFQTLKNLRYTDTHVKAISGMAKVVTSIINAGYMKVRSAFHYLKAQPFESHILVQAYNTALTGASIFDCITTPPTSGVFSSTALFTDSSGFGLGRFSDAPDGQMIYCNGVDAQMWGGTESRIGAFISLAAALSAATDSPLSACDYTENIQNTNSSDAITVSTPYLTIIVGSNRPAQGAKFYLSGANDTANTLVVKESRAGAWNELTVTNDGTRVDGKTFKRSGTISWASPVSTTKPRYINGYYQYWYQFAISAGAANIYHVTLDLPWQGIIDLWDGVYREVIRFYKYVTGTDRVDKTTNVLHEDFDDATASTYFDASSLAAATDSIECGFTDRMTALFFKIPEAYTNGQAAGVQVSYWSGVDWATVGSIADGTSDGANSLASSGVMSWNNVSLLNEIKKSYYNDTPLYFYKVAWNGNLDASVRIDYIAGIPASKTISYFKFPVFAQGRVLLCADMSNEKNKALVSSKFMPQVYNGADSVDLYFGDEKELSCGTELFSQYGSSLYSLILMFKDFETWVTAGQDITQWENNTFLLSSSIGCPAPMTLKTINLRAEPGAGINRALAIWQGANGIYMSDGRAPIPVHGDIEAYFDPQDPRCIDTSMIGDSYSSVDEVNQVYVWKFASGASTSLNKELGYDIKRNKWFEVERPTPLQCGLGVHDADGNSYLYGFTDDGYMYRLNYGTSFDSVPITYTVQFGDMPLGGLGIETRIRSIRLFEVAKTVALSSAICTHYADGKTTGTEMILSPVRSGYRIAQPQEDVKLDADPFHSMKLEMTTNNEQCGMEPIALVISHHSTHQD